MSFLDKFKPQSPTKAPKKQSSRVPLNEKLARKYEQVAEALRNGDSVNGYARIMKDKVRFIPRVGGPAKLSMFGVDEEGNQKCLEFANAKEAAGAIMLLVKDIRDGNEKILDLIAKAREKNVTIPLKKEIKKRKKR